MEEKYEPVRASGFRGANPKEEVNRLREITKRWSNGATMTAINEELHLAETTEKKMELLIFKCEVLEGSTYGRVNSIHLED